MSKLGIPYMGSKRKLAHKIINKILLDNPNTKYFYDLFGGGGSISFEALQRNDIQNVYYNEFNKGIVELLKKIKEEGVTKEFYKWVSKEEFLKYKDTDDWYGGLLKSC